MTLRLSCADGDWRADDELPGQMTSRDLPACRWRLLAVQAYRWRSVICTATAATPNTTHTQSHTHSTNVISIQFK